MNSSAAEESGFGLVQVYTGSGKGKTTAALGLALRAAGWGYRTFIGQFMKGQKCGELQGASLLSQYITIEQFGRPDFVHDPTAEDIALADRGLRRILEVMASGEYQIVVMDEICVAIGFRLVTTEDVLGVIERRHPGVELILTGRGAPRKILDRADLVTEAVEVKHPHQRGVAARRGIEY